MIPIRREPLSPSLSGQLQHRTERLGPTPTGPQAREAWTNARQVRSGLKKSLSTMAYRNSFCMYCQESFGTDIDHYQPLFVAPRLAFTWDNHLLACGYCNQQAKCEVFPTRIDGTALLLDPTVDDAGQHFVLACSGELVALSDRGQATLDVLRLNTRADLRGGRAQVLHLVEGLFRQACQQGRSLAALEIETLRCLAYQEVVHLFAHAVHRNDLSKLPRTRDLSSYALSQLPTLRSLFPCCAL